MLSTDPPMYEVVELRSHARDGITVHGYAGRNVVYAHAPQKSLKDVLHPRVMLRYKGSQDAAIMCSKTDTLGWYIVPVEGFRELFNAILFVESECESKILSS